MHSHLGGRPTSASHRSPRPGAISDYTPVSPRLEGDEYDSHPSRGGIGASGSMAQFAAAARSFHPSHSSVYRAPLPPGTGVPADEAAWREQLDLVSQRLMASDQECRGLVQALRAKDQELALVAAQLRASQERERAMHQMLRQYQGAFERFMVAEGPALSAATTLLANPGAAFAFSGMGGTEVRNRLQPALAASTHTARPSASLAAVPTVDFHMSFVSSAASDHGAGETMPVAAGAPSVVASKKASPAPAAGALGSRRRKRKLSVMGPPYGQHHRLHRSPKPHLYPLLQQTRHSNHSGKVCTRRTILPLGITGAGRHWGLRPTWMCCRSTIGRS
jgi:hypothetical protein